MKFFNIHTQRDSIVKTQLSLKLYLSTSDVLKAQKLLTEVGQPDCMMEDPVRPVVIRVGPTNDTNHRQVLTVRAGDRVENAQPTNSESHHARAHAPGPRVAVGGVPGVELVAAADQVQLRLGDQVVQEGQVKVTGHGEDVPGADLDEPPSQVAAQRAARGGWSDLLGRRAGVSRGADVVSRFHVMKAILIKGL